MYEPLLLIHSAIRWIVLIAMCYFLVRSIRGAVRKEKWTGAEQYFVWAFDQAFGYQVLFGFTLWLAMSPFTKAAFLNPAELQSNPVVRFWTIRHALTMLVAFGLWHAGRARAKRAAPELRYRIFAFTFAVVLALVLSAIPWPGLSYGRPLLRLFL